MAKHKTTTESDPVPPPAPPADVMTPDPPERNPPAREPEAAAPVEAATEEWAGYSHRDALALHAALSRLGRLLGYSDEHMPPHGEDIDTSRIDRRLRGLVEWAKTARLP